MQFPEIQLETSATDMLLLCFPHWYDTLHIYIYTTTLYSAGIFSIENVGQHVATAPAISNNR